MYGIGGGIEKFKSHELRLVKCALVDDKIRFCHKAAAAGLSDPVEYFQIKWG